MNPRYYFLYGLLIYIPYFLRPDLIGADPYFYLGQVCGAPEYSRPDIFIPLIRSTLNCDIIQIKVILGLLWMASLGIIYKIGELFNRKMTVLLVLLTPLLLIEFLKFENEAFALPLVLLSTYFYFRWRFSEMKRIKKIGFITPKEALKGFLNPQLTLTIGLTLLTMFLWKGSLLYLVAFFLPLSLIPILLLFIQELFSNIPYFRLSSLYPNFNIGESLPLQLTALIFLSPGILQPEKYTKWMLYFFLVLGLLQARYVVHSVLFLALSLENYYEKKKNSKVMQGIKWIPFIWILVIFLAPPHPGHWELIDSAIDLSEKTDLEIINDFDLGYWLIHKGYNTKYYGWPQDMNFTGPGIMLTQEELEGCELKDRYLNKKLYLCKGGEFKYEK